MLVFCPPQGGVPSAMKFLTPSDCQARRRGRLKWVWIGFPGDSLGHGILNPSGFSSALDQAHQDKWTLKVKEETFLNHLEHLEPSWTPSWCSGVASLTCRWRHAEPPSPSGICQVRLFSSQLGRRQNGNLSVVIEWKYQKLIGYWDIRRENEKEK